LSRAPDPAPPLPPPPDGPPVVVTHAVDPDDAKPLPGYLDRSLAWLAEAQFDNGGWGAGQHTAQGVRDPHAVQIDPATTAFAALALLRAGSTPDDGPYADNVRRALTYLVGVVEEAPANSARITSIEGTQPQAKLGRNIDAALAAQLFTAALPHLDGRLERRTEAALDKCLLALQRGQTADGSQAGGGWAPVLQSAMATSALERAQAAGRDVDEEALDRSRADQRGNITVRGGAPGAPPAAEVDASAGAGVALYAASAGQRATAQEAREAATAVQDALGDDAEVTEEALRRAGRSEAEAARLYDAYSRNAATATLLEGDEIWSGFGNNGGEEFLSYMMTSESLVIAGGDAWDRWHARLVNLFGSIQNGDGSWSGHHCITSPVFCTAAVILALTADRDATLLAHELQRG
ncbi:MAG: hypothetical protein R3181_12845, partial [Rubricoccaceae bacterium]|nr:hypothetical protein [Rubricoccaceae bacterium]